MADINPPARAKSAPKGAADLAQRMGATLAPAAAPAEPKAPAAGRQRRAAAPARPAAPGRAASRPARGGQGAGMPAEQAKPAAFYSARVSHATTPEQLAALEQIRLTENTQRRAARRPAISITALLRAATEICLENDRLRAQMIKRAGEEWN